MAYIIENANLLKEKRIEKTSLLIKEARIASLQTSFKKFKYMKMNANSFIMTPPHIVLDSNIPLEKPFQEMKEYYINQFIKKGCTAFVTPVRVGQESMFQLQLKKWRGKLIGSPIDFIIGVRIPVRLITPGMIRKCKKEKIPVIFIEVQHVDELEQIPWGWIREAMFPYNSPLVPILMQGTERERKQAKHAWKEMMSREKIPSISEEIEELVPISYNNLCKIGILPLKSHIHPGGELSYNFYEVSRGIRNIDELQLFHYHNHRLVITVHKGSVIRAGEEVLYRPGFGEHVIINTPSFFANKDE
ncbi:hypothetical protein SM124_16145 [Bacillus sp. 31A1R]|uniref:PIN domain-containing protein n=1 Tax=Robertmurraya mangrovi TaxID=3098077 RepID=A0ABU5J1F1_9BACI|nr:hypothetical protein [Bacillus sp. 31A1R]MDZ5473250.1 hypothetical protein [Bacillus sp. 31A1R]